VLAQKNRVGPKIFHCIEYIFYHSGFLNNLRLSWKTKGALEFFTVLKYFVPFWIFEQLALALKTEFALKFFKPGGGRPPRPPASYAYV